MSNNKPLFIKLLSVLAISANVIFVLWILYNGINENFTGTMIERLSYISLMLLLLLNTVLLIRLNKG